LAALKVIAGFDCVSFGTISIDALFIVLIARRVDLIIDCPISEFFPVNGTRRPILILLFARTVPGATEKVKAKKNIILIILFILMLLL
jgi:hypothetical protein